MDSNEKNMETIQKKNNIDGIGNDKNMNGIKQKNEETIQTDMDDELSSKRTKLGNNDTETSLHKMKKQIETNKHKYDDESRSDTMDQMGPDHVL